MICLDFAIANMKLFLLNLIDIFPSRIFFYKYPPTSIHYHHPPKLPISCDIATLYLLDPPTIRDGRVTSVADFENIDSLCSDRSFNSKVR